MAEVSVSLSLLLQLRRRVRVALWPCSYFILKSTCPVIFRCTGRSAVEGKGVLLCICHSS